jgi:drug/metabolite transporter (DMT)-like permease
VTLFATPHGPASRSTSGISLLTLGVGLLGMSASGTLIASISVPALAIGLWRTTMAALALAPFAVVARRRELATLSGRTWRTIGLAGALFSVQIATFVPSLALTSVASATALAATQPMWAAVVAAVGGTRLPMLSWAGTVLTVLGACALCGLDLSLTPRALVGDALALASGFFAAGYVTAGAAVRRSVSTVIYTWLSYSTSALLLLALCLVMRAPLHGYSGSAWLLLGLLALLTQLIGHGLVSKCLQNLSPTTVSVGIPAVTIPVSALLGVLVLGQTPPLLAVPAGLLLLAGVVLVLTTEPRLPAGTGSVG